MRIRLSAALTAALIAGSAGAADFKVGVQLSLTGPWPWPAAR